MISERRRQDIVPSTFAEASADKIRFIPSVGPLTCAQAATLTTLYRPREQKPKRSIVGAKQFPHIPLLGSREIGPNYLYIIHRHATYSPCARIRTGTGPAGKD